RFGREPRRRGLKRRGRGAWSEDKPPIFIPVERGGGEDYAPSSDASGDTVKKIVGRRASKGSTIHTDGFPSYSCLGEARYKARGGQPLGGRVRQRGGSREPV
ncbi:MAG: transposase, partial [Candidatus Freyarchaeota archaeon]